jgi:hypothetical protein
MNPRKTGQDMSLAKFNNRRVEEIKRASCNVEIMNQPEGSHKGSMDISSPSIDSDESFQCRGLSSDESFQCRGLSSDESFPCRGLSSDESFQCRGLSWQNQCQSELCRSSTTTQSIPSWAQDDVESEESFKCRGLSWLYQPEPPRPEHRPQDGNTLLSAHDEKKPEKNRNFLGLTLDLNKISNFNLIKGSTAVAIFIFLV